jgi:hypothetical protein
MNSHQIIHNSIWHAYKHATAKLGAGTEELHKIYTFQPNAGCL